MVKLFCTESIADHRFFGHRLPLTSFPATTCNAQCIAYNYYIKQMKRFQQLLRIQFCYKNDRFPVLSAPDTGKISPLRSLPKTPPPIPDQTESPRVLQVANFFSSFKNKKSPAITVMVGPVCCRLRTPLPGPGFYSDTWPCRPVQSDPQPTCPRWHDIRQSRS